jgi:heme-degrading monooxygenase HmoA
MIIREWRGRSSLLGAEAYPQHFRDNVVPQLRQVEGFIGAHLARRRLGDKYEFVVLTRWRSLDAVRAFAGADIDEAVVEPGAIAALAEFDTNVQHYEIIEELHSL